MTASARRRFLRHFATQAAALATVRQAWAVPATRQRGTIDDVRHVVILMQENRSFDHYFGTLRGVRGFDDRFPWTQPDGRPVWQQSDGARTVTPYHMNSATTRALRAHGTPHRWPDAQDAWNDGRMDGWLRHKTERSLGHHARADLPLHFALADAFTLCDAYHCSMQAGTHPNRLFAWSGHNGERGEGGGPALVNTFEGSGPADQGYHWETYPERLERAGIRWMHYQDMADNFGDNPLESFRQYRAAGPGSALRQRALTTRTLDDLARDVRGDRLPQVSWIIAPEKRSEHPGPSSPPQGIDFTLQVLAALTANPAVWSRTVLFVNYDENDGFFDHVPPPAPPARAPDGRLLGASSVPLDGEHRLAGGGPSFGSPDDPARLHGRAYGLGPRVPMFVISPWSRGGWVNSEVFDHTSVLRFLERRFSVEAPGISAWRRAVCGDLTSAFDFRRPVTVSLPALARPPQVDAFIARHEQLPHPRPPAVPALPAQERGLRPSRALPYALQTTERRDGEGVAIEWHNTGRGAVVLQVRDGLDAQAVPRRYTVGPGHALRDTWPLRTAGAGAPGNGQPPVATDLDLQLHGPNGLYRAWRGAGVEVDSAHLPNGRLALELRGPAGRVVDLHDRYGLLPPRRLVLPAADGTARFRLTLDLRRHRQWYDLELTDALQPAWHRRLAGRVENGHDGVSDIGLA